MVIQYYGKGYVKASLGERTLSFNPPGKGSDLKGPRFGADIVLVSSTLPDYNGVELAVYGDRMPLVIDGPGEYEVGEVVIRGVASKGIDGTVNTVYIVRFDDIMLCHLGALFESTLSAVTKEAIGDSDILFVPTYGGDVLDASSAQKLSASLNPKLVIPMYYGGEKRDTLKQFLKEAGEDGGEVLEKLTIKKKDLEGKEGDIAVVKSY